MSTNTIKQLNLIYQRMLRRNADPAGIKTYGPYIEKNDTEYVINSIRRSAEYRKVYNQNQSNFNSLTGDRHTHISSKDTSMFDNSIYANYINILLSLITKVSNSKIDIKHLKLSLAQAIKQNKKITIFPHQEHNFNSSNFIDSLKNIRNFQYFVLFLCISDVIKYISDKIVATCGTSQRLAQVKNKTILTFTDIYDIFHNYITDYLSIRISGRLLTTDEKESFRKLITSGNAHEAINLLQSISAPVLAKEKEQITQYLAQQNNKPKVLLHIAYLENQEPHLVQKMLEHAYSLQEHNPLLDISIYFENDRVDREPADYTPWSRVKRIRNIMLNNTNIDEYDYIYVIDSDVVSYPYDFVSRAIGLNPTGITAPVMLIENSTTFYDWCGYQQKDRTSINSEYANQILNKSCSKRNFNLNPPYVNDENRMVEIDCVGCTYVVPTYAFKNGYGNLQNELLKVFDLANVDNHKIKDNIVQYEDHPTFTDHYTVCTALRANGGKVYMDRGSVAYHADLPMYGEAWH